MAKKPEDSQRLSPEAEQIMRESGAPDPSVSARFQRNATTHTTTPPTPGSATGATLESLAKEAANAAPLGQPDALTGAAPPQVSGSYEAQKAATEKRLAQEAAAAAAKAAETAPLVHGEAEALARAAKAAEPTAGSLAARLRDAVIKVAETTKKLPPL